MAEEIKGLITAEIKIILHEELAKLRERIKANMDAAGQTTSGKTAESMNVELRGDVASATGILSGRQAFATLETGSSPWSKQPGRVPRFFADIIGEWIEKKGLDLNKWAVAHSIIRKGSSLYRSGGRADIYSPEIEKTIESIGSRMIDQYAVLVTDRLTFTKTTIQQ